MSTGTRIPLARAQAAARYLIDLWQLEGAHVVGSVRRQRSEVGDLDLIIPAMTPTYSIDSAFLAIDATMRKAPTTSLFDAPAPIDPIGRAVRGLKPGFLACKLVMTLKGGQDVGLEIERYTPENLGWKMLERTGPGEFGKWFLWKWKERHNIPRTSQGSISGHLVDAAGKVIPTRDEDEAFALCGLKAVAPERRDEFIARVQAGAR